MSQSAVENLGESVVHFCPTSEGPRSSMKIEWILWFQSKVGWPKAPRKGGCRTMNVKISTKQTPPPMVVFSFKTRIPFCPCHLFD